MAGIGKLAKLLIKMGKKDLVREFSKSPIKTTLKTAGKATIWPLKKVGQGIAYAHKKQGFKFNDDWEFIGSSKYLIGGLTSAVGGLGMMGYGIYEDLFNGNNAAMDKWGTAGAFAAIGLILGGPIGAAIGCASALTLAYIEEQQTQQKNSKPEAQEHQKDNNDDNNVEIKDSNPQTDTDSTALNRDSIPNLVNDSTTLNIDSIPNLVNDSTALNRDSIPNLVNDSTTLNRDSVPNLVNDSTALNRDSVPTLVNDSTALNRDSVPTLVNDSTVLNRDSVPTLVNDSTVHRNDSVPVQEKDSIPEERKEQKKPEEKVEQPAEQSTPAKNNLFGGAINEITKKDVKIVKGDCLWNIAKRELQNANPGKTITNAQILKQVKEFGRLNPEMFGPNPSLKKLDLIYPDKQLKLSA